MKTLILGLLYGAIAIAAGPPPAGHAPGIPPRKAEGGKGATAPSPLDESTIDLKWILEEVRRVKPASKAEFLRLLPPGCKTNYLLVYRSLATACSSYEKPRTIITCSEGSTQLILAIDGEGPGVPEEECRKVEILATSEKTGEVSSAEIRFTGKKSAPFNAVTDPPRCYACHGRDLKHLADRYPHWPGFFQSAQKDLKKGSPEHLGYEAFLAAAKGDPLYSQLQPYVIGPGDSGGGYLALRAPGEGTGTVHSSFFNQLDRTHAHHVGGVLTRNKTAFSRFQFALAAALLGCEPIHELFPKSLRAAGTTFEENLLTVSAGLKKANARVKRTLGRLNHEPAAGEFDELSEAKRKRYAGLMYVAERMGIDSSVFSTSMLRSEFTLPTAGDTPLIGQLLSNFGGRVSFDVDDAAAKLLRDRQAEIETGDTVNGASTGGKKLCATLREKSLEALKDYRAPALPPGPKDTTAALGSAVAKCVVCHASPLNERLGASRIPFGNLDSLRASLRDDPALGKQIRARLEAPGRLRMPPNESLEPEELKALEELLSK